LQKEDTLQKRYIVKLLATIVRGIASVAMIAIVPHALGTVAYGYYTYLYQFFNKVVLFFDAGSSTAFFTKLSADNLRKELITFYGYLLLAIFSLMFLLIYLADRTQVLLLIIPDIPSEYIYIALIYAELFWLMQIFTKIADAYALTVSVELIKIIHTLFSLLILVYLVYLHILDLDLYFLFLIVSSLLFIGAVSLLYYHKGIFSSKFWRVRFDYRAMLAEFIDYCSPMLLFIVTVFLTGFFDLWLLQFQAGVEQTGFYGLAFQIATVSFMFTNAMTPIITREFSKYYGQQDINKMRTVFARYIPMLYAIAAYFGLFIAFEAEDILHLFTDERFYSAAAAVAILALYPIHQTYGHLSGSLMLATDQVKLYRNTGVAAMVLGVLISVLFVYILEWGAMGLALKMVITQMIGVNIQLYYNTKYLAVDFYKYLRHQLWVLLFFAALAYISTQAVATEGNSVIHLLVSGIIYTILTGIGFFIFPHLFAVRREEIIKYTKKILKRK
jgi:O-antigen/teichoic acid export membrane protein